MNILITGAGGFAGRNLQDHLAPKYNIFAAAHTDLDLLDANAVKEYLKINKIDIIIHCAATGGSRRTNYDHGFTDMVEKNLRMFFNLERCLTSNMLLIYMGSGAEYDRQHWRHKMKEDYFDQFIPVDSYGYAKYLISKFIAQSKNNIVCLRIFGLFGKYEDYRFKFISNSIVKNLLHMPIIIKQNVFFDYLYISDFVAIVELYFNKMPTFKHYNITPTNSIDLMNIVDIINQNGDYKSDVTVEYKGLNLEYTGDNSRLLSEFPFLEFRDYQTAIKELYTYYSSVFSSLDIDAVHKDIYLERCQINYNKDPK